MSKCPNKTLKEWGELSNRFGNDLAYKLYWMNNDNIPTIDRAKELLNQVPEIQDSFYLGGVKLTPSIKKQLLDGLELYFLNTYFDETSGDFDSLFNTYISNADSVLDSIFPKVIDILKKNTKNDLLPNLVDENKEYLKELLFSKLNKYGLTVKEVRKKKEKNTNDEGEDDPSYNDLEEGKEQKGNNRDSLSVDHAIYYNSKTGFPKAVKLLIASSIARNSEGKPILSRSGLPTKDLRLESLLLNTLADVPWNIDDQIAKLESIQDIYPSVRNLIKKLGGKDINIDKDILTVPDSILNLRRKFSESFGKHKYEFLVGLLKSKDIVITNANQESLEKQIENKWASNFIKYISRGTNDEYFQHLDNLLKSESADKEEKIAKALGFEFTNKNLFNPKTSDYTDVILNTKWNVASYVTNIAQALVEYYKNNKETYNPEVVYSRKGKVSPVIGNITKLINHISKQEIPTDLQLINGEGKTVYSVNLHTYQSLVTTLLNDRTKDIKNELPHLFNVSNQNSVWLNEIDKKKAKINMVLLDALSSDIYDSLHLSDIKENDMMSFITKLLIKDIYPAIKHADRSMFPAYTIDIEGWSYSDISKLVIQKNGKTWSGEGIAKFKDVLVGYLWDEYNTAKLQIARKIDNFDANKNKSYILDGVNWLNKSYASKEDLMRDSDINTKLNNFVNSYLNDTYNKFESYGLLQKSDNKEYVGLSEDDLDEFTKLTKSKESAKNAIIGLAAAKYFIGAVEQSKLFLGNPSFYNIKNEDTKLVSTIFDIFKRANMQSSSKGVTAVDRETNAWVSRKNQNDRIFDSKTGETFVYKDGKADGTFTELVINDDAFISSLSEYFKNLYGENNPKYKSYLEFVENDGISLVNPFFNREFQHRRGDYSPSKNRTFQKELRIINEVFSIDDKNARDYQLKQIHEIPQEVLNQHTSNGVVDYDAIFLEYYSPFVVEKPQYLGPNYGMSIEEYKSIDPSKRLGIVAGRKTSYMNLLPSMVIDTILEDVLMFMLRNGIDTLHFKSAAKFGGLKESKKNEEGKTIVNFRSFYNKVVDENGNNYTNGFNDSAIDPLSIGVLDFRFLGKQQEISGAMKEESTESTQKRKIIQSGIMNKGLPIDYQGTKEEWIALSEQEKKQASPMYSDLQEYINSQNEIIKLKLQDLLNEFGYVNNTVTNPVQFINSLIRQAKDRNSPDNILESLQNWMTVGGGLRYIETLPNYNRIQNILNSLINNNVINEKRPGTAVPQIPSTGFEKKGTQRRIFDDKIESQNALGEDAAVNYYTFNEDGTVNPAEIMIPLPTYWINPLFNYFNNRGANLNPGDIQGLLDLLNASLANGTLKNLATYTGLRIPNQQLSSTDVLTVKKFFHPSFQSGAVVPSELVVKTGGDFDIDKLNLYFLNLNNNYDSVGGENYESTQKILNENIPNDLKIQKLQNFNLKKGQDLLLKYQPQRFLSPVDDSSVKDLKKDQKLVSLKNKPRNHIFQMGELPSQTTQFLSGKGSTGIFATWITFSNLAQVHNIEILPYYYQGKEKISTKLHFKKPDGSDYDYSLGNASDNLQQQIEDVLSALLTSQVDIVKDAYATDLSITTNTANTIAYLVLRGVPIRNIITFLKQPIIATYINERNLNESLTYKLNGLSKSKKNLLDDIIQLDYVTKNDEFILNKFLIYEETAKRIGDFKAYISADTSTLKDLNEYDLIENDLLSKLTTVTFDEQKQESYFTNAVIHPFYIDIIKKQSVIGEFFEARKSINDLYNNLYLTRQPIIKTNLKNIKHLYANREKQDTKNKIYNIIDEEFINYLIQTKNDKFKNKYDNLITGENSLAKRLIDIKKEPRFENNLLIQNLISILNSDNQDKIKLFAIKLTTPEINEYSDFFKSIKYVDESLYEDLIIANAFISGLSPSAYQLSKIIPYNASKILLDTLIGLDSTNITDADYKDFVLKLPLVRPDILPKFNQRWKKNTKKLPFYKTTDTDAKKTVIVLTNVNDADQILIKFLKNTNYRQELSQDYINYTLNYVNEALMYDNYLDNKEGIDDEADDTDVDTNVTEPTTQISDQIYAQLGDKTQSENVEIPGIGDLKDVKYDPKTFWSEVIPEARAWFGDKLIIAYRGKKTNTFLQNYKGRLSGEPALTIGNPFDFADETGTRKEQGVKSTKKFIEWMITGNNFGNSNATEEYRQAIIEDIKNGKLKNRPIIYYQEKGYATHATALDYLINKYDWSKPTTPIQPQADVSDIEKRRQEELKELYDYKSKASNPLSNYFINEEKNINAKYDAELDALQTTPQPVKAVDTEISITNNYKYYGRMYDIIVKNNIGVDVVGYKGKNVDKQKLLDAYNTNPNIDPQNGKPFKIITPEVVTAEKVINKPKFTYKEKSINTDFVLTNSQTKALESLIDFALSDNKNKSITLQGPAGTGKTSVIGYLQKYLNNYNFVYMAPTHAATAELAFATSKLGNTLLPMTVQSAFFSKVNPVTGIKEAAMTKKLIKRLGLFNNIIVLDESSMLTNREYDLISEILSQNNIKIIYMGDFKQIPEVDPTNPEKKNISKAFTNNKQIQLTEVKRTNSDSILEMLENIRNNPNDKIPIVKTDLTQLAYLNLNNFNENIVKFFNKDPENTVLINYTNNGVQEYNRKIRESIGRRGDLQKDDIIVGYLGYATKQIEESNIANSIRYTVNSVEKIDSYYQINASSKKLEVLKNLGVSVNENATTNYLQLSRNDSFNFSELKENDFEKNNKIISDVMVKLYETKQKALNSKTAAAWANFYNTLDTVGRFLASHELGNTYVYNPQLKKMELYNYEKHKNILNNYPELKIEKGLDFGHAVTIHKSQGSTVKNVFFDASSLPKSNISKLYMNDILIGSEKHSLLYVGVSRASDFLGILSENLENFYTPVSKTIKEKNKSDINTDFGNIEPC